MGIAAVQRKFNVRVCGRQDAAATLFFSHGFGTDQTSWASVIAAFEQHYRIVTFDHAGAGQSDPAAFVDHQYLSLRGYANDVLAICEAYKVRNACLIGHSAGGISGALATLEGKEYFSSLVLLAASPRYLNEADYVGGFTPETLRSTYSAVMGSFHDWVSGFAPLAMNNPERPELAQYFAATIRRIKPENVLTVLCSILQSDHRADIRKIAIPTLIIQSRDDYFVPVAVAEYLHRNIAGSKLAFIDAKGHFPHITAPSEVIRAIRDFLPTPP